LEKYLRELFYSETEQSHLQFESSPEYCLHLSQAEALYPNRELPAAVFQLLDTANRISFIHGFRLGLGLARWSASCGKGRRFW